MRDPISLLKESIQTFRANAKLFIGIYLIPGALSLLLTLITEPYTSPADYSPALTIVIVLLAIVAAVAGILMAIAITLAARDQSLTVMGAYQQSKPFFWQYLWLSILVGLTVIAGFVLLVIPGIIFMVWFSFAYFFLLFEGVKGVDAMKRSRELVRGRWFPVFGRFLLFFGFSLVIGFILGLIQGIGGSISSSVVLAIPGYIIMLLVNACLSAIGILYIYGVYRDLQDSSPSTVGSVGATTTPETSPLGDDQADTRGTSPQIM